VPTTTSGAWLELNPDAHAPACHGALLVPDPPAGRLLLWGGSMPTEARGGGTLWDSDRRTWTWDGANWSIAAIDGPGASIGAAATGFADGVLSFGGFGPRSIRLLGRQLPGPSSVLDDTWQWSAGRWDKRRCAVRPRARCGAALSFDESNGTVVLFGGGSDVARMMSLGDTWLWDGEGWSERRPTLSPPPRAGATMYFDQDAQSIVLTGGTAGLMSLGDTWRWDGMVWVETTGTAPPPLREVATAYHAAARVLVMFGGRYLGEPRPGGGGAFEQRTWTLRSGSWQADDLAPSPAPRIRPALAYHSHSEELVLFGGLAVGSPDREVLGDTWTFRPGASGSAGESG
jgi:hypothetical protein